MVLSALLAGDLPRSSIVGDAGAGRPICSTGSRSARFEVDWALRVDALTAVMLVVVTSVSSLVHLYSVGYMDEDQQHPALLGLSVAVHLRDADAGDRRQPRPDVLRLGRRRPRLLPADRLLVHQALGQRRGDQGLRRQPRRRLRLRARHLRHLPGVRHHPSDAILAAAPRMAGSHDRLSAARWSTR